MKARCIVWYVEREGARAKPSLAYGDWPERDDIMSALHDMSTLRLTSMRTGNGSGRFFACVVEYPDGHPPLTVRRDYHVTFGGNE